MISEVIELLKPASGRSYVDGTVGSGGHARAILQQSAPDGRLLGIDADSDALDRARSNLSEFSDRIALAAGNFASMDSIAENAGFLGAAGVLLDLGFSSEQIDDPERGFSFRLEGPLDMRFDRGAGRPAWALLERLPEERLADVIYELGEERRSRRIARTIVSRREKSPVRTTTDLAEAVIRAVGGGRGKIHPATRTFQALRIYVNAELERLQEGLEAALRVLARGGRLAVISFHSLEDRIVKTFFRSMGLSGRLEILTPKPLRPSAAEARANPRSRSARLRAAEVRG